MKIPKKSPNLNLMHFLFQSYGSNIRYGYPSIEQHTQMWRMFILPDDPKIITFRATCPYLLEV